MFYKLSYNEILGYSKNGGAGGTRTHARHPTPNIYKNGGSGEIRTLGGITHSCFQDKYHKPLGHASIIYHHNNIFSNLYLIVQIVYLKILNLLFLLDAYVLIYDN